MRLRDMMIETLTSKRFDGLYSPDEPCGCLNSDLGPCGGDIGECCPGIRRDFAEDEDCGTEGCDGNRTKHWHIVPSNDMLTVSAGGRKRMTTDTTQARPPEYGGATGSESWWNRPVEKTNGRLLLNVLSLFISGVAIGINIGMILCRR